MTDELINLNDFEKVAENLLSKEIYDYYAGGAGDEITLLRNREVFNSILLNPRVLNNTEKCNLSTQVMNLSLSMPVMIAPMAFQQMATPNGEIAMIRAAAAKNILAVISTLSNFSLEEIKSASSDPAWFQLYIYNDRNITEILIRRAEQAGYTGIVLTVDVPIMGMRERDIRNQFNLPNAIIAKNFSSHGLEKIFGDGSAVKSYTDRNFARSTTWDDIAWLQSITTLPIILKGIMCKEDAVKAVEANVAAIVISNHGGRQLDTVPAPIEVLPSIKEAVGDDICLLIDSGFRRGIDILKALALGADSILIGRPILWGLAVNGQKGAETVLEILRTELLESMILCGCSSIAEVKENGSSIISSIK